MRRLAKDRLRRLPVLLGVGIVAVLGVGCAEEVRSDPDLASVESQPARLSGRVDSSRSADAYQTHLYSERDADLFTRMYGDEGTASGIRIKVIHVEIGDRVQEGQLLATLDDEMPALEVEMARPAAEETRLQLERAEELKTSGVVTPSEYEEVLFANRRAEAVLKQAENYLARTRVRAPFSGIVSRRYVRVGQIVGEKDPLFRVTAMAPLRARLLVPEDRIEGFRIGAPVLLRGTGDRTATARVILVGPTVDAGSGTREVIVELRRPDGFTPGATVVAERLGEAGEDIAAEADLP